MFLNCFNNFLNKIKLNVIKKNNIFAALFTYLIIKSLNSVMTKAEIVAEIANKTGVEKTVVQNIVESFMDTIKSSMVSGENVYLRGFGSFTIKTRAEKTGRNISKNTTIIIPAHNIPTFKPAKTFVNEVKDNVIVK
jgi:DNA-binding protein HU-beta